MAEHKAKEAERWANEAEEKYKLESALKSCGLEATIEFTRPGGFIRKEEVSFKGNDIIKEILTIQ